MQLFIKNLLPRKKKCSIIKQSLTKIGNKRRGREKVKVFYGGKFIEKSKLEQEGIYYPIKLEYYKRLDLEKPDHERPNYGISIVKTEYNPEQIKIETKDIRNLTQDEEKVEEILFMCKQYDVTPIGIEDIIQDLGSAYKLNFQ